MIILGIGDGLNAGAVLIRNGEIIAALNEERLDRVKLSEGFPLGSITKVLEIRNLSAKDIDLVVLASKMTPCVFLRAFEDIHKRFKKRHQQFSYFLNLYLLYHAFAHRTVIVEEIESWLSRRLIERKLLRVGVKAKVLCIDHHLAHAYAAFTTSALKKALIFTMDGFGDGISITVNIGLSDGKIKRIYKQTCFCAISTYYSRITEFLGFKPIKDEGKVTGLAAYADGDDVLNYAKTLLISHSGRFNRQNYFLKQDKNKGIYKKLQRFRPEEIAAAFQMNFEREVTKFISYWIKKTGIFHLALSGGAFANVKLNQRIHELPEVDSIYIFPHMGDGGLAMGAALSQLNLPSFRLKNLYLGPKYTNDEIKKTIDEYNLSYNYIPDIEREVANFLAQGKVVAYFDGRLEYGPRALGNRSILYQPTDPTIKDWLNKRLKRTEFMPFAPVTLAEYAGQCYHNLQGAGYAARFMNIAFDCTEWMKKNCPGAVHVDGTARPQLISQESNPRFYRTLDEYRKITGLPCLINTSFNIHEQPIVCSPSDAVNAFRQGHLDYLAIGNYLVKNDSKR